jgi:NADH-quinone oxidoreductase subunit F
LEEVYKAVFIAPGAQSSRRIGIMGEEENLKNLYYGLQFLTDVRAGKNIQLKGKTVVLGGGNVAIDAARTAPRVGAQDVQIFYRRTIEEMPAWKKDIEEAVQEGIVINPLWAPKRIVHQNGKVTGIEFLRSKTVFDQDGRSRLSVDEDLTQVVQVDTVIIAIGQAIDASFLSEDSQLERSLWGSLAVDGNTLATNVPGIFAGGDFITGPSTVIQAIASGRRAALAIDKYLVGEKGRLEIIDEKSSMLVDDRLALAEETLEEKPRIEMELEEAEQRVKDFREVEKGFSEADAQREAARCLRCDLEKKD